MKQMKQTNKSTKKSFTSLQQSSPRETVLVIAVVNNYYALVILNILPMLYLRENTQVWSHVASTFISFTVSPLNLKLFICL